MDEKVKPARLRDLDGQAEWRLFVASLWAVALILALLIAPFVSVRP